MKNNNLIFLNKNLNCVILNKNKTNFLYFYNSINFFLLNFYKNIFFSLNRNLNIIIVDNKKKNDILLILNILNKLANFYYKKIIFTGKGFKLKKKKNINMFFFNNSHIKILLEKNSKILKNSKNSFLLLFKNKHNWKTLSFIKSLFFLNIFTKKGLKLSRDIMLVKKIKKK